MKILFLVGSAEPGRDGVGDYTRILAKHCETLGHECRIASLHDPYILDTPKISQYEWRYPNALTNEEEKDSLIRLSEEFNPDWVSLQFVPYAFHPKGLPRKLPLLISQIARNAKFHIMFHETWAGPHIGASIKDKVYGFLQKALLRWLIRHRPPDCVHTHASPYMHILRKFGLHCKKLPLFSNIPIAANDADSWLFKAISEKGALIEKRSRNEYILLGIFGSIYPELPVRDFCKKIKELTSKINKECILIFIGHSGNILPWKHVLTEQNKTLTSIQLGQLTPSKVSEALQSLDWGVATPPWSLIEKGSSVATLLAHGLPIIVPRDDIHFDFKYPDPKAPGLIKLNELSEDDIKNPPRRNPNDPVQAVTRNFLADLATCPPNSHQKYY